VSEIKRKWCKKREIINLFCVKSFGGSVNGTVSKNGNGRVVAIMKMAPAAVIKKGKRARIKSGAI
jgi:hypothetical protein